MSYFLYDGTITLQTSFCLKGPEALHLLQSRRIQIGEVIEIQDQKNVRYQTKVDAVSRRELTLTPITVVTTPRDSHLTINLYQALVKEKSLELVLQKSTELGVSTVTFFQSGFSQRLKKDIEKQKDRWEKICIEACKQSGRAKPPKIEFRCSLSEIIEQIKDRDKSGISVVLDTTDQKSPRIEDLNFSNSEVDLFIGPEGGWQDEELNRLEAIKINLGQRILRSETAAITAAALLQYLHGDLNPS